VAIVIALNAPEKTWKVWPLATLRRACRLTLRTKE
jgi:hypothetical protein